MNHYQHLRPGNHHHHHHLRPGNHHLRKSERKVKEKGEREK
jgi:hypothetical protein